MEIEKLKELLSAKCLLEGYELVSLNMSNNKDGALLSLVVDRVKPINMDDIITLSGSLNPYIDEIDPFSFPYTLDISSLGAEKPLKIEELSSYLDSYVNVHLTNPVDGENIYEGYLSKVDEENIQISYRIKTRNKIVDIAKANISKIRLAIKF